MKLDDFIDGALLVLSLSLVAGILLGLVHLANWLSN